MIPVYEWTVTNPDLWGEGEGPPRHGDEREESGGGGGTHFCTGLCGYTFQP